MAARARWRAAAPGPAGAEGVEGVSVERLAPEDLRRYDLWSFEGVGAEAYAVEVVERGVLGAVGWRYYVAVVGTRPVLVIVRDEDGRERVYAVQSEDDVEEAVKRYFEERWPEAAEEVAEALWRARHQ